MATVERKVCDLHGNEPAVHTVKITYRGRSVAVDLCAECCEERVKPLMAAGKKNGRSNPRRFAKSEVREGP